MRAAFRSAAGNSRRLLTRAPRCSTSFRRSHFCDDDFDAFIITKAGFGFVSSKTSNDGSVFSNNNHRRRRACLLRRPLLLLPRVHRRRREDERHSRDHSRANGTPRTTTEEEEASNLYDSTRKKTDLVMVTLVAKRKDCTRNLSAPTAA